MDAFVDYFIKLFDDAQLNDIVPAVLSPTWSNGRAGRGGIAKNLDRFLMADGLCEDTGKFRSWSLATGFSNHRVVHLQLDFDVSFHYYPFKFNPSWLKDEDFNQLIREQWGLLVEQALVRLNPMECFLWIMNNLRLVVIDWEHKRRRSSIVI